MSLKSLVDSADLSDRKKAVFEVYFDETPLSPVSLAGDFDTAHTAIKAQYAHFKTTEAKPNAQYDHNKPKDLSNGSSMSDGGKTKADFKILGLTGPIIAEIYKTVEKGKCDLFLVDIANKEIHSVVDADWQCGDKGSGGSHSTVTLKTELDDWDRDHYKITGF